MPYKPRKMPTCSLCGHPMSHNGTSHNRCRDLAGMKINCSRDTLEVRAGFLRVKASVDEAMTKRTKHWNVSMGRKRFEQMFPDLANRI